MSLFFGDILGEMVGGSGIIFSCYVRSFASAFASGFLMIFKEFFSFSVEFLLLSFQGKIRKNICKLMIMKEPSTNIHLSLNSISLWRYINK